MQNLPVRYKFALHAASVLSEGGALLFLGHSGAGKSTMCNLVRSYMPTLAEDMTYIVPNLHGGWSIAKHGGYARPGIMPSPFEEADDENDVPVRAIFRLYQASKPVLERTDPLFACRHLTDAFFEVHWQRRSPFAYKRYAFRHLAQIAQSIPGYAFYFDLSARTACLLRDEIELLLDWTAVATDIENDVLVL